MSNSTNNLPQFLRNLWYLATTSDEVKRNKTIAKQFLSETILLGRDELGNVFAMQNVCPHRGVPLTEGTFDGNEIECCYHGWRFNTAGTCTRIPSLTTCQRLDISRIKVTSYPIEERNGLVWIFMQDIDNPIDHKTIPIPTDSSDGSCSWPVCPPFMVVACTQDNPRKAKTIWPFSLWFSNA